MPRDSRATCGGADAMNHTAPPPLSAERRLISIPRWLLALLLLLPEFALYAWWVSITFVQRGEYLIAAIMIVGLPLLARLLVALAGYALSRWRGIALTPSQRLGVVAWLRFFAIEYGHLCAQNLVLTPFRHFFHTQSERGHGPADGRVVLLQHGFVNNGAVWFFTARALEANGFRVFAIDQPTFVSIETMADHLAARVDAVLAVTGATQLTLVAHSMGGLIARAYLRRYGNARIERLVTMGSPHHGTFHAYLALGSNALQMRPGNTWLVKLGETRVTVPFTSIYSIHDTVISPQDSSVMAGADNVQLSGVGHVSMPSGAATRKALFKVLGRAA